MSLNHPALVAITPQTPHQNTNSFIKNITTRSSFCGTPTNPKSFLSNRKSWNGNGTLPLQTSNNCNIDITSSSPLESPQTPVLATFKSTGTFPRKNSYQRENNEDQRTLNNGTNSQQGNYFDTPPRPVVLTPNGNNNVFTRNGGECNELLTPNGNSSALVRSGSGCGGNETRRSAGNGRRYAEIGNWNSSRGSSFLESHIKGVGWRGPDSEKGLEDLSTEDDEQHLLKEDKSSCNVKKPFVFNQNIHSEVENEHKSKTEQLRERFEIGRRDEVDGNRNHCVESRFHDETTRVAKEFLEKSRRSDEWRKDIAGSSGFRPIPESELSQSRDSLSSRNSCGGSDADGDCECDSSASSTRSPHTATGSDSPERVPCDISLLERLIRTHSVWFLPGIQRAGAFHLLQGKEEGNFIVRQSSQPDTMALSVRLPVRAGPYIEHYLIHAFSGRIGLETSQNKFDNIPDLIAHYSQCCDELPVQLVLPRALREAKTRQQLSSLALLGQEFWRYPMANPKQNPNGTTPEPPARSLPICVPTPMSQTPSDSGSSLGSFSHNAGNQKLHTPSLNDKNEANVVLNLTPMENTCSNQTGSGTCVMSTFKGSSPPNFAPPRLPGSLNTEGFVRAPRPTPPNTLNLLSSTAHLTQQTPNSNSNQQHSFSNNTPQNNNSNTVCSPQSVNNNNSYNITNSNSSLNCNSKNTPPPPPPRWAKPPTICGVNNALPCSDMQLFSPLSTNKNHLTGNAANITVTTTVTFSVNNQQNCTQLDELLSPSSLTTSSTNDNSFSNNINNTTNSFVIDNGHNTPNNFIQTNSKRLSPEGECLSNSTSSSMQNSLRRRQKNLQETGITSPIGQTTILSPDPIQNKGLFSPTNQIASPNSTNSATSGIFSPSQINSPLSNTTVSLKSGIFSSPSPALNKSELFSPISRSSPMSTKSSVFSPVSNQNSFTNNSSAFNSPLMGKERDRLLSPSGNTVSTTHSGRSRRKHSTRKESRHYQESDILETSGKFYRSSLGDKVSDYEDIWGPEGAGNAGTPQDTLQSNNSMTNTNTGSSKGSTFRPNKDALGSGILISKRPDLLPDTLPKVTSLNNNVLNTTNSPHTTDNDSDKEQHNFKQQQKLISQDSNDQINNMVIATTNSKGEAVPKRPDKLNLLKNVNEQMNIETNEIFNKQQKDISLMSRSENEIEIENHKKNLSNDECLLLSSDFCNSADDELQTDKQNSPFYADPVDALKEAVAPLVQRRRTTRTIAGPAQRYSEPPSHGHPYLPLRDMQSIEELSPSSPNTSSSVDNLVAIKSGRPRGKAVQPPKIKPTPIRPHDPTWTVDSSWEFISKQSDNTPLRETFREGSGHIGGSSTGGAFPSLAEQQSQLEATSSSSNILTIHQVLAQRFPELNLSPFPTLLKSTGEIDTLHDEVAEKKGFRMSSYDNVESRLAVASSQASDDGTVFSEPWDCYNWDSYLPPGQHSNDEPISIQSVSFDDSESSTIRESSVTPIVEETPLRLATISRARSFRDRLDPLLAPPRIQALRSNRGHPGKPTTPDDTIRAYALHLAADKTTVFAQNVENFISCTKESKETCPHVVMRNMRQFMSGMKNYLVKHGEREFEKEVEKARTMLKPNEFLNLDAILEDVLYSAVVTPLRTHVYGLLADKYVKSGDVAQLDAGMKICRALPPLRVGIKPYTRVPRDDEMVCISTCFLRMQEAESPSQKMEFLLSAISGIFQAMKGDHNDVYSGPMNRNIGADDFLPYLVYCLARCSLPGAELEAELMAGLLPPRMLSGEGGYYLTTLFGAVAILKQLAPREDKKTDWQTGSLGSSMIPTPATTPCASGGVAKVLVPDECSGALRCLSLPWRAGAKAKDICRVLAHRTRITDAQDYGLFVLRDGEETLINDTDCPQDIIDQNKCNCMFAYKRVDAKIAWPKQALTSYP